MLAVEGLTRARRASSLAGRDSPSDKAIRKVARVASPISEAGAEISASAITTATVTRRLFDSDQSVLASHGAYFAKVSANATFAATATTATSGWRSGRGPSATAQYNGNANNACRAKLVTVPEKNETAITAVANSAQGRERGASRQSSPTIGTESARAALSVPVWGVWAPER